MAVAMVFVVVVAAYTWAFHPPESPPEPTEFPEYHAVDIVIEETNVFRIGFNEAHEGFFPDRAREQGKSTIGCICMRAWVT